jgi:CTP synthase (UTP-ammonia lyase)
MLSIALIGDFDEGITAHCAIVPALARAAAEIGVRIDPQWHHTSTLRGDVAAQLASYAAIWCAPGSPYANTAGVLAAIRYARTSGRPFLGTCAGFQHALLEYAADVWGVAHAAHAELEPAAADPVIAPLECGLVEVSETLQLERGSRLALAYGRDTVSEDYHCRYGLNPRYAARLEVGPLRVSARDSRGAVRAVELDDHPFFVATLFQPERAAFDGRTPPIAGALLRAAIAVDGGRLKYTANRRQTRLRHGYQVTADAHAD